MADVSTTCSAGSGQTRPITASLDGLKLELPEREDAKVWRFLNLAKTLSFLQTSELYLRRSDLLQDLHEGSVTRYMTSGIFQSLPRGLEHAPTTMRWLRQVLRKAVYLSCWYLDDGYGIAIQTRFSRLKNIIKVPNIKMGKILYADYDVDRHDEINFPLENLLYPFFRKRKSFAHEKEFRLMLFNGIPEGNGNVMEAAFNTLPESQSVKIDLEECVETLVVSPHAPSWFFKTLERHLAGTNSKLRERLVSSQLSVEPYF